MKNIVSFLIILFLCNVSSAQERKRIYIACDDHTDYMWSADEDTYHRSFVRMLDYYLDLADQTQDEPSDYQSRFVCDGSYWLWIYEQSKSPNEFERLISRIRSGHITVPMNPLAICYGGMPAECVIRSMFYPGRIERRYNLRFRLALSMENQTLPWGLSSIWAGSGAKYSWKGICGCASKIPDAGDREHDIYYYQGPDGQRILMKWNSMLKGNQGMGGYAEARSPWDAVYYTAYDAQFKKRYPYNIIGCFGKGWDDLETRNDEFIEAARSLSSEDKRVIVSNSIDFFVDFEQTYGEQIPTESRSYGNEWELYNASLAEQSARIKRAMVKLRSAEAMASIIVLQQPDFIQFLEPVRDRAYFDLGLYFEHSWTGDGPVSREDREHWQKKIGNRFVSFVDDYYNRAVKALSRLVTESNGNPRFIVFNPLGWSRTDYADIEIDVEEPFQVVDRTNGKNVPYQWMTRNGKRVLRVLAFEIPPVGYKVFEIRNERGESVKNTITTHESTIENDDYRITVSPGGSITQLIDKRRSNRNFAKRVNGRWINDIGSATGTWEITNTGPVSTTLRTVSSDPLQHTSEITLFQHNDRIEIVNEINENFSDLLTYGFGLNIVNPVVHHEEIGAIAKAKTTDNGGQYATRCARYDWLTFNHFADMTGQDGMGITISNLDSYFFKLGNSSVDVLDDQTPILSALIGGQVDGRQLGMHDQGGEDHFLHHFALRTHDGYDPVAAMKFSMEHQHPLIASRIATTQAKLPESLFMIQDSNPSVLLWALKPAEDGIKSGWIVRLWNVSDSDQTATIQTRPKSIQKAWVCSHVETDEKPLALTSNGIVAQFKKQQIQSFRMILN